MIKYYSAPGHSIASRIVLEELGLPYDYIEVSWETNANIDELVKLNPLKMVPTLLTEQGNVLTQTIAIFEYLADLNPSSGMLASHGTWERTETMSWTAFAGSDLQKAISLVFQSEEITEDERLKEIIKAHARKKIAQFLAHIDTSLVNKNYIMGDPFTIADPYLFTMIGFTRQFDIDTTGYANITAYIKRIFDRPAVKRALAKEGLQEFSQKKIEMF